MGQNTFKIAFEDGTTKSVSINVITPKDIVMFVAGTTDPINTASLKHQANKDYWRGVDNFWSDVKALKPQFLDLHIEDSFFSWSGDNSTSERNKAADRLLDLFLRVYKNWTNDEVHLHLIGHSHGGNVINQFTDVIANNNSFPEKWEVKSITYLSTPFFKEQHQLNDNKLHSNCKIINVYNEYDITQRFVADFTLKNLESIIFGFDKKGYDDAMETIDGVNFSAFNHLKGFVVNNHTEGPEVWRETSVLLEGINQMITVIKKSINFIGSQAVVSEEKLEFLSIVNDLSTWSVTQRQVFIDNENDRDGGYGRSEFFEDLDLLNALLLVNRIFEINSDETNSYLLGLLDSIFTEEESGLIFKIDDTSWTPTNQINGKFEIEDFNISDLDIYDTRDKKTNFEKFSKGIEDSLKRNDENSLKEALMSLISQFITTDQMTQIIDGIWWLEFIVWGSSDTQLKLLNTRLKVYRRLVEKYNSDLIADQDLENDELKIKPGSLPYLAMTSHGLSHTKLFDDEAHNVKESLISAFSSGKNPGYRE